jgi:hypothetical protein
MHKSPIRERRATAVDMSSVVANPHLSDWKVADALWWTSGHSLTVGEISWKGDWLEDVGPNAKVPGVVDRSGGNVMRRARSSLSVHEDAIDFWTMRKDPSEAGVDLALLAGVMASGEVPAGWDGWWVR